MGYVDNLKSTEKLDGHREKELVVCPVELFSELKSTMPIIRALTVTAANLVDENFGGQLTLTDTFLEEKKENLENTVDKLRDTYGKGIIKRGSYIDD